MIGLLLLLCNAQNNVSAMMTVDVFVVLLI